MNCGEPPSRGPILGAGAMVLAALCCFVGPAILGAVAGATVGRALGIIVAIVCASVVAAAVALILRRRQSNGTTGC